MVYSAIIHERFRRPRFKGELADPDATFEDVNPVCGDRIRIELRFADSRIVEARFRGDSCAICTASADILIEMVQGQSLRSVEDIALSDLLARLAADIRPARLQCVRLPLRVLCGAVTRWKAPP